MTINVFVIKGKIRITEKFKNKIRKLILNENSNKIVTIKPNSWVKYTNLLKSESKIVNFANRLHDKYEILKR